MTECCANCRLCYKLEVYSYIKSGCEHATLPGHICMAFADEETAVWQVGLDENKEYCEAYTPKEEGGQE